VSGVSSTKKNSFLSKKSIFASISEKKPKMTNEDYTNNGERQVSSIPFLTLNFGIALSESTL
jgi:hypothetical protein